MRYLFLYTELAGYTIQCFRKHLEKFPEDELVVVHYPVNSEAPFQFETIDGVKFYLKDDLGLDGIYELVNSVSPDLIVCSGWADREYVKLVRLIHTEIKVTLCFDNIWHGTFRQRLLLPVGKYILRPLFRYCWVPGVPQRNFALKMGFAADNIFTGFYATDIQLFNQYRERKSNFKRPENDKKRLLCVARYIPEKGYDLLWQQFIRLYNNGYQDWELWCVGTGELYSDRVQHEAIRHLGFVQPDEYEYIINNCDIFVLPSLFEPWGMVVQEFAAAGFPLVLSSAVGSKTAFMQENENGMLFQSGNAGDLYEKLAEMMKKSAVELENMGRLSAQLADANSAENWSLTLRKMSLLH